MSITERIKGIVMGKKKQPQQPTQIVEHQHHWVQPPPQPKTFSQKIESLRKSTDRYAKKSFGSSSAPSYVSHKSGAYQSQQQQQGIHYDPEISTPQSTSMIASEPRQPISQKLKRGAGVVAGGIQFISQKAVAVGRTTAVSSAIQKAKESKVAEQFGKAKASAEQFGQFIAPPTKKEVAVMKATAQQRRMQAAPILSLMGGNADPYHKPVSTVKMGRRISKREAKRLKTLYGENWAQKLQKNSQGYYAQPTPADLAQARKERKLTANSVDFGHGFESMKTGMEVSLTRDMGNVVGDRESEDPFNIDARFGGASASLGFNGTKRKSKNPYDINANFNTGGFRL